MEFELNDQLIESKNEIPRVAFWYPRLEGKVKEIEVALMDTRSADSLRISYDFERDGYVIKQASTFEWDGDDPICDQDWQEVAFIQAWAREKPSQT